MNTRKFTDKRIRNVKAAFLLLIVSTALFMLHSCKEEEYVEQSGFTCTINGRSWWPLSDNIAVRPITCILKNDGESLEVKAFDSSTGSEVGISLSSPGAKIKAGTYILNSDNYKAYYDKGKTGGNYVTAGRYDGTFTITDIDYKAKTLEAIFKYKAFNGEQQEVVNITDGRLSVEYIIE